MAHDINDALREVSSGIEYVRTDLGKTVLTINRWMSPWHTQSLRGNPAFEGIMIGGNADDLFKIYVTGTISSDEVLDQLGELIVSHAPPFDVVYNVCVTGA
ncbi:hypothetical protein FIL88_16275 [Aliiroseovarius halocynthiae]|uniref:Uncharacterized protein n=1 Tax=Aliiroseovarius halocynthiae TaxID=985055 RepID=A0A545SL17_9RHOB|nr:hypothetical protein FIL88_16275 [Aliiroseovarius halocynthiae]